MPRGNSGRIVLEVDLATKRELYSILARDGLTLKAWFLRAAREYISRGTQPRLRFVAEPRARYDEDLDE